MTHTTPHALRPVRRLTALAVAGALALTALPAAPAAAAPQVPDRSADQAAALSEWRQEVTTAPEAASSAQASAERESGRLLVTTETDHDTSWALAAGIDATPAVSSARVQVVEVPDGQESEAAARIAAEPGVVAVEPVLLGELFAVPDDELYDQQWAHQLIRSEAAWDVTTGLADTTVVIADTGMDARHPDLSDAITDQLKSGTGEILPGVEGDNDRWTVAHGTAVGGIAGAVTDNGIGVAGVAWRTSIVDIDTTSELHAQPTLSGAVASISHAAEIGADAVNLSLGFGTVACPVALQAAVDEATAAGTVVVAAAGNAQGQRPGAPYAPASCDGVVSVGAVERDGSITPYSSQNAWVDLSAPAGAIADPTPDNAVLTTMHTDLGDYIAGAGTSAAAPHVAGAVALLRSIDPDMTVADVEGVLQVTSAHPDGDTRSDDFGWGVLDLGAAAELVQSVVDGQAAYPVPEASPPFPVGEPSGLVRVAADGDTTEPITQAVEASRGAFADGGAAWGVVAREDDHADALAGAPLTFGVAPVLYAQAGQLPAATAEELTRALPDGAPVYVLGGTAAIADSVVEEIEALGFDVLRIGGPTRTETAELVAEEFAAIVEEAVGLPTTGVALATAHDWPDAIAAGSLGVQLGMPVLLTTPDELHPAAARAIEALQPQVLITVGGAGAVAEETERRAAAIGEVEEVVRLGGGSRVDTAVEVGAFLSDVFVEVGVAPINAQAVNLRRADGYAHVLSATPLLTALNIGVLVPIEGDAGDQLTAEAEAFAAGLGQLGTSGLVVGGHDLVSPEVEDALAEHLAP